MKTLAEKCAELIARWHQKAEEWRYADGQMHATGLPFLDCERDLKQALAESQKADIEADMGQPYCEKHSPRGITCACDAERERDNSAAT
jgi:hypothetical protein